MLFKLTNVHILVLITTIQLQLQQKTLAHFAEFPPFSWWSDEGGGDEEVVYLPALVPREPQVAAENEKQIYGDMPLPYTFDAFGRNFDLHLVPNRRLVSSEFTVWSEAGQLSPLSAVDTSCHYLHAGRGPLVAALSACRDHTLHGLIVVDNSTFEVHPLSGVGVGRAEDGSGGRVPHVIRRAFVTTPAEDPEDSTKPEYKPTRQNAQLHRRRRPRFRHQFNTPKPPKYTIEIALFLDTAAYKIFNPLFNYNEADLRDMMLAYINGVQALYYHVSLGVRIQLSLVRITLLRTQPAALPAHAERGRMLDTFCAYQRSLNVQDDEDPAHWDMALLLSGLDLYAEGGGHRSATTMGLAPVGGVCLAGHSCVVAEFGPHDSLQRPYPSAGFTSVYILAHEIGHNLGMHHDGIGNSCSRDGYIMSPSRGTNGEATWSPCSARIVSDLRWATCLLDGDDDDEVEEELRHERYSGAPGAHWGAKRQCEVLLRDRDASPTSRGVSSDVCSQLTCVTPHRAGVYYSGPALPGTPCGDTMWCQGGECVPSGATVIAVTDGSVLVGSTSGHRPEHTSAASETAKPTTTARTTTTTMSSTNNTAQSSSYKPINSYKPASATKPIFANKPNSLNSWTKPLSISSKPVNRPNIPVNSLSNNGWTVWKEGSCNSACTHRSRGFREKRRTCLNSNCDGAGYDVALCDDTKVCGKKSRVSASELASRKCAEYAGSLADLDPRGAGLQAPHDPSRMWMGCAVFCRRGGAGGAGGGGYYGGAGGGGYYAPRVEVYAAGLDPYFPDGTWCHHDGTTDYYCLHHHCLPENFKMNPQWHVSRTLRLLKHPTSLLRTQVLLTNHDNSDVGDKVHDGTANYNTESETKPISHYYLQDKDYLDIEEFKHVDNQKSVT